MPAAMEGWRSSGGSSKEEQESGGTIGSGADTGGGKRNEVAMAPVVAAGSKRQRRPSVRLGEIGDLKVAASKSEALSTVRWISPNFMSRKSPTGLVRGAGKLPRTRPLANVTHRGEIGQVLGSPKVGTNDLVVAPPAAATAVITGDDVEKEEDEEAEEEEEAPGPPSTSGRGSYSPAPTTGPGYGNGRKGRPGKRKRAASIRSSTIAKTIGVVALNRKAKELQKVEYIGNLAPAPAPAVSTADVSEMPAEFAELSGTQADMEEDSGAAREGPGNDNNDDNSEEEEHTQNGDTEVLEDDDGNGEDSSGRPEEDEPGASPGVRDNQNMNTNGALEAPHEFPSAKDDQRDQCTSRLTDGEKDSKKGPLNRDASMNGRRGEARGGVRGWLSSLGLDKYRDVFEENEVDNDVLHLLTFEDLREMGIVAVGARRKMFAAIQELSPAAVLGR